MNVPYLITFTTKQLQNYYMHVLCSLKSCSKVSTKRERQLIVILDTFGRLFSDLSVCQESTLCLQTTQNIQKKLCLRNPPCPTNTPTRFQTLQSNRRPYLHIGRYGRLRCLIDCSQAGVQKSRVISFYETWHPVWL